MKNRNEEHTNEVKINIEDLPQEEQIAYYKQKLEQLEKKHDDVAPKRDDMKPNSEELHVGSQCGPSGSTSVQPKGNNRRKELADYVERSERDLDEANKQYSLAQDKAAEILEDANEKASEILRKARAGVKAAERIRRDAILAFNKEFGTYTATYSGQKAIDEFNRSMSRFMNPLTDFFKFWF